MSKLLAYPKRKINNLVYAFNIRKLDNPVIVYTMGKVGSNSIITSLHSNNIHPSYKVHRLNLENIRNCKESFIKRGIMPPEETTGKLLNKYVIKKKKPAKFITLIREPIGRNMSAFFHNFRQFTGDEYSLEHEYEIEKLISLFLNDYPHEVPLTWFDLEIKKTLNIDVYAHPFPKNVGYQIINNESYELLILKLELDDDLKSQILAKFLGLKEFNLSNKNIGDQKSYSEIYRQFKNKIKLPTSYVDRMCHSKFTKHFYTDVEIQKMRAKWLISNAVHKNYRFNNAS